MSRLLVVRSLAAAGAVALGAATVAAPAARAQSATLTFDGLAARDDGSGVIDVANCYREAGIRVTLVGMGCDTEAAFSTWTADNPLFYTGSPALFNNLGPSVDFTATNGRAFAFRSIGLAPALGGFGLPASVLFTGFLENGGTVTRMVDLMGETTMLSVVQFSGFTNLRSVRMTVTTPDFEPYVQFDNVGVAVVPEPATVALFGVGLAGLGAVARRRRQQGAR